MHAVLGADAVGAYLLGSAVLDGLKPTSDLDVLVVSRRRTTTDEKRRLVDRLLSISGRRTTRGRWRRVEVTVVAEGDVKPWRYPPRLDFQYGDWLREAFEAGDLEPWEPRAHRDLATLMAMARLADAPLFGPSATEALDAVPPADVIRAGVEDVDSLLGDLASDTTNVVLTLARIWATAATGEIRSKDAAAEWALERLPEAERLVVARARSVYLGLEEDRWRDLARPLTAYARRLEEELAALAR